MRPDDCLKIYCIAGEASGDFIGASTLKALSKKSQKTVIARGIGGQELIDANVDLFFDYHEISVMGIFEIIPHFFRLKRLIQKTIHDVIHFQPDVLLTIDSSGFCNRVIDGIKKELSRQNNPWRPKFIHYVAPPVWAWRPWRAKTLSERIDHLLCLFPFEPPYFTCHGLKTTWVGHPLVESISKNQPHTLRTVAKAHPKIALLLGSRAGEIRNHLPIFKDLAHRLHNEFKVDLVIPTFESFKDDIQKAIPHAHILTQKTDKDHAMQTADLAVAVSGTVSLILTLLRTPTLIVYKTNKATAWFVRHLIKTPFVALPNILVNQPVIPELIQEHCTPDQIFDLIQDYFKNPQTALIAQQNDVFFDTVRSALEGSVDQHPTETPSDRAATAILSHS